MRTKEVNAGTARWLFWPENSICSGTWLDHAAILFGVNSSRIYEFRVLDEDGNPVLKRSEVKDNKVYKACLVV